MNLPEKGPALHHPEPIPPAHHRPPAVEYRNGVPYHYTVGQPPAPQHITVQLPDTGGMSQQQREFMLNVVMWLVVAVVLTGCVIGVTVIAGGTLMGLIGAIGANAVPIGLTAVGVIMAAAWAAGRIKPLVGKTKEK